MFLSGGEGGRELARVRFSGGMLTFVLLVFDRVRRSFHSLSHLETPPHRLVRSHSERLF